MPIKTETKVGAFVVIALSILFYMSFYLGVFRFDKYHYSSYTVYFDDISGLEKKGEVKMAGVKVGWIDTLELVDGRYRAKASIRVNKKYHLRKNAYAVVRQDGLLGTKYLEVIPGDPHMPELAPSEALARPGRPPASIDEILQRTQEIAVNINDVTDSMQDTFGGYAGKQKLKDFFDNLAVASERIATFSNSLDRTLAQNERSITTAISDFQDLIPSLKMSINRIAEVLDRDFNRMAENIEGSTRALETAANEARDGIRNISEGKGFIGKLVSDETMYRDFSMAVKGVKNYINRIENLGIVFDSHSEFMMRHGENISLKDYKGVLDVRLHPSEDYFLIGQMVSSIKGTITRHITDRAWWDEYGQELNTSELLAQKIYLPEPIGRYQIRERKMDQFLWGFQIGKIYKDVALRAGIIENSGGFGIDVDIPFGTDNFRWVTSFEVFDMRGRNRFDDSRPHLKWLNRVFLFKNMYMAFGADDFVSRNNANAFFGGGIRFSDDDVKYIAGKVGLAGW